MCLHSYEYFHSKIAAQICLNRSDRLVHGDTIADDPRLRVDGPLLADSGPAVNAPNRPTRDIRVLRKRPFNIEQKC